MNQVKFKNPVNEAEAAERFVVLELRGDRILVEAVCSMQLRPTMVYLMSELVDA